MGRMRSICNFRIRNNVMREFLAEYLGKRSQVITSHDPHLPGTALLVVFGSASVAQSVLSLHNSGDFLSTSLG